MGLAVATLLLALSACQSSESEGPSNPTPSTTPPTSQAAKVPPPTPTTEPARGPVIDVPGGTLRAIKGFHRTIDYGLVQGYGNQQASVLFSPSLTNAKSLAAFAKETSREKVGKKFTQMQDNVAIGGGTYSAFHLIDTSDPLVERHMYGVMYLDGAWSIDFSYYEDGDPRPLTADERQAATDSMLDTFAPHRENLG